MKDRGKRGTMAGGRIPEPQGEAALQRRAQTDAGGRSPLVLAKRLRETLDNMLEGCQIIGYDWRYLYVNDAVVRHGRKAKEQLLGKTMMEAYPGIENTELFAALKRCMQERVPLRIENEFTYPDGQTGWFELSIEPAPEGIVILSVDITDHKRAEENLRRTARALRTVGGCNEALVQARDETELLQEVCRVIVEVAGYRLAWIGLVQEDDGKTVQPVAQAGYEEGSLDQVSIGSADSEQGWGSAETAVHTRKPVVCTNILADPQFASWRGEATRRGFQSSIVLPLMTDGHTLGVLNICAASPEAFDSEEAKLLEELAVDIAFGIDALRARVRGRQLSGELRESQQRYQLHFEHISDVVYSLDPQLRVLTISPSVQTLLGYAPEELVGRPFPELGILAPQFLEAAISESRHVLEGGRISSSVHEFTAKDGTRRIVELSAAPILEGEEVVGAVCVARDVTDRVGTERALEHTLSDLRQVLGGIIKTLGLIVERRDPYTAGHQRRVSNLARAIATEMGVPLSRVGGIRVAGSIHDLGKVSVPAEILSKPARLSENELKLVQAHAQIGYDFLKEVEFPWPVADIVLQHHERLDGSGYPNHLLGDETLLEARILAVADVVDAMSSHRPYRPALAIDEVMQEISRGKDTLYDAQAVLACLRLFQEKGFRLR